MMTKREFLKWAKKEVGMDLKVKGSWITARWRGDLVLRVPVYYGEDFVEWNKPLAILFYEEAQGMMAYKLASRSMAATDGGRGLRVD